MPVRAQTLVLLHGVGSSAAAWDPLHPYLSGYELVSVDLPGSGSSPRLPAGVADSIPAYADVVERDLLTAGIEKAHLVGNSSGGWLALELARRGRALSVVAISPAGMWRGWERRWVFASLRVSHALARLVAPWTDSLMRFRPMRLALWQYHARPGRLTPVRASRAIQTMAESRSFHDLTEWTSRNQPAGLEEIAVPVLIAWGTKDRLLFGRQADRFAAALPRVELLRLPGVGHVPMDDDPELVARVIRRFVDGRPPAKR